MSSAMTESECRELLEAHEYYAALGLGSSATPKEVIQRVAELETKYPDLTNLLADAKRALTIDREQYDAVRQMEARVKEQLSNLYGPCVGELLQDYGVDLYDALAQLLQRKASDQPLPQALLDHLLDDLPPTARRELKALLASEGGGATDPVGVIVKQIGRQIAKLPELDIAEDEVRSGRAKRMRHPMEPPCECKGTGVLGPCIACGGTGREVRRSPLREVALRILDDPLERMRFQDALERSGLPRDFPLERLVNADPDATVEKHGPCSSCRGTGVRRCSRVSEVTFVVPKAPRTGYVMRTTARDADGRYAWARIGKVSGRTTPAEAQPAQKPMPRRTEPTKAPARPARRPAALLGLTLWDNIAISGVGLLVGLAWLMLFTMVLGSITDGSEQMLAVLYYIPPAVAIYLASQIGRALVASSLLLSSGLGSILWPIVSAVGAAAGDLPALLALGIGFCVIVWSTATCVPRWGAVR